MAIIIDTDVIVRGEKGAFDFQGWLASEPDEAFEVAAITIAELWHGIERAVGPHRTKRREYIEATLASLSVIPYTERTAQIHARVWAEVVTTGKMIGYYDLIVAATALEHGSPSSNCSALNRRTRACEKFNSSAAFVSLGSAEA